ncbi:MAG: NDP-hexose 2,3-dehydratase family protein [Erysipelotrichaceae bacterium]|nr:NDP-hexose 2,3-dehydratase family protein [Erysipelotrichaceae bacterium]
MHDPLLEKLIESWSCIEGNVNSTKSLLEWIDDLNKNTIVNISQTSISDDSFWFYDDYRGEVLNRKRSFFSIIGMRFFVNDVFLYEQPIIQQKEIGFLGIIAKEIDGVMNFLMQAKIEPGNVNCVQISPTIQATKSNFIRAHGGRLPYYFEWFEDAGNRGRVIYDQIQSEQGSRFDGKRNRNIILLLDNDTDIEIQSNYRWMTLGQLKMLSRIDNLVNMDTRTVLSGIPTLINEDGDHEYLKEYFRDQSLYKSFFSDTYSSDLMKAYSLINDYKMKNDVKKIAVPLGQLVDWKTDENGIVCKHDGHFEVRYYDIEIEGREVRQWTQPLFKAKQSALFVLFTKVINGERKFLVRLKPEIGCFDQCELGPSIQYSDHNEDQDLFLDYFRAHEHDSDSVLVDVMLSEEGGRFYHEQNRNVIIEVKEGGFDELPYGFLWMNYASLNFLCMSNNYLNIQLRSLLSLIRI